MTLKLTSKTLTKIGFSFLVIGLMTGLPSAWADKKHHHHHGSKAHEHGAAELSIAVDGERQVTVTLETPTHSVLGFEHAIRKGDAKKTALYDAALAKLKAADGLPVVFDAKAGCSLKTAEVTIGLAGGKGEEHSDTDGKWTYECNASVSGTDAQVTIQKEFPKMSRIKVRVLSGGQQSETVVRKSGAQVKL